ncbi:unnamed protein product [Acanthoscelides obtectus]|uniref:Uncharacterized protein n=1 Tax=Acanthoscelides obtectus TaxID=200917 RepID=A0A9P0PWK7_ACAOB|nr:unnamed protein product [Acanthoscelides obtectus]CAK1668567.1 hypothetical protein AOBTE_LOCUS26489 [Acanthoscelides obtectus]
MRNGGTRNKNNYLKHCKLALMIIPPIKNQLVFKIIQTFSQFSIHGNVHMGGIKLFRIKLLCLS